MNWQVFFKRSVKKQMVKLPEYVIKATRALVRDIEQLGPMRYEWKNFGKLKGKEDFYHCHIKTGRPTYVVCWEVTDKKIKIVEVYYVGTHEKAPY